MVAKILFKVSSLLNSVCIFDQVDPFAQHRQPTIAEREDEYRARRRQMVISPPRHDPFADGRCQWYYYIIRLLDHTVIVQQDLFNIALFVCRVGPLSY